MSIPLLESFGRLPDYLVGDKVPLISCRVSSLALLLILIPFIVPVFAHLSFIRFARFEYYTLTVKWHTRVKFNDDQRWNGFAIIYEEPTKELTRKFRVNREKNIALVDIMDVNNAPN